MSIKAGKYRREDFSDLPVRLHHLTIYLSFLDGIVEAANLMDMTSQAQTTTLALDAKALKIISVQWCPDPSRPTECRPLDYDYRETENKLLVFLPEPVAPGTRFGIRTVTQCTPSDHILEGIYRDVTPPGAPQQYMSQCQQWGFQRIMPIFDDCRAKCTMTTTLEADARYTHLISNGNISREINPDSQPIPKPGDPTRRIIRYENPIPIPPYLFLACAGTWDTLRDQVTYPSGRSVQLEYLVPPGRVEGARIPMEILKQAVLWVQKTQGYEYPAETYRTICMNKSNFGGMENTGNTTIVTDAALIDEHTLDQTLIYAHAVIVHEFEHNECGSETTMESPFDVWLNEAYTVDVERRFMADLFDPAMVRLSQVDAIRNPLLGPLAIEDSGAAGRIVRESFDDPDELIDGVTYVKAAEVIRMLRLILGKDDFRKAKELYFSRYRYANANTDQFFQCFEEVSGRSLEEFKRGWLMSAGYPSVAAGASFDRNAGLFHIDFEQACPTEGLLFTVPVETALIDGEGRMIPGSARVFELKERTARLTFKDIAEKPAVASMNRDCSFYGTFSPVAETAEDLAAQVRRDNNSFNRVEAVRRLTDRERIGLLGFMDREISPHWLSLYGELLQDRTLSHGLKAYLLRIDEQPLDRTYCTWFPELAAARDKLILAVNARYRDSLVELFHGLDTFHPRTSPKDGIEERMLKNILLELIAADDTPESHALILDYYRRSLQASDRVAPLAALNRSSSPERLGIMEKAYRSWHGHVSGYANYLRVVASGTRDDVFDMIQAERVRSGFDITHPTWSRALFLPMAVNNKMVWQDRGIGWVRDTVTELASINPYVAGKLLNAFQHVKKMKPELREKVTLALEEIVTAVSPEKAAMIHGQAKAYLD